MNVVIIGSGRVGSSIAKLLQSEGWDVTVIDEKEEALNRLGANWPGGFVVGHGMDTEILHKAGIEDADAVVVADERRQHEHRHRPGREEALRDRLCRRPGARPRARGLLREAWDADRLPDADRDLSRSPRPSALRRSRRGGAGLMYVIVAGGGKVGANVARSLLRMGHEVTLIEQRPYRYERLEEEFEHQVLLGDATELHVLEKAGIARPPDLVLAVTGDDEDNLVICQIAREGYNVPKVIARVNDPRNQAHFELLGITQTVCATSNILGLVEHEVPEHELVHLLELRNENLEIVEVLIEGGAPCAGKRIDKLNLPDGARVISVVRAGVAQIADSDTEIRAGDQVLAILEPGKEDELRRALIKAPR